jgi:hypothetical protein
MGTQNHINESSENDSEWKDHNGKIIDVKNILLVVRG